MTISSTTRIAGPFTGNGVTTTFPFTYKVFDAADVQVIRLTISTGLETTLTIVTDYTIALNSDQDSNPGGNIVLVTPLLALYTLTATSDIANLQPTDLTNQGGFYPEVITDALDRATIQIQQLADQTDRAIKIPISDGVLDMTTPNTADRLGKYLAFDSLGLPVVSVGTGNDTALRTDLANASASLAGSRLSGFRQTGTGATARTVDDKLKDTVSVKDFGAVGDGVTDDTAAIQAALDSLKSGNQNEKGSILYFPNGLYKITSTIYITLDHASITLFGDAKVTLFAALPDYNYVIDVDYATGATANFVTFNMYSISINDYQAPYQVKNGIRTQRVIASKFVQCEFQNLNIAVNMGNDSNLNTFDTCMWRGNNYGWKSVAGNANNNTFLNCQWRYHSNTAFDSTGTGGNLILGGDFEPDNACPVIIASDLTMTDTRVERNIQGQWINVGDNNDLQIPAFAVGGGVPVPFMQITGINNRIKIIGGMAAQIADFTTASHDNEIEIVSDVQAMVSPATSVLIHDKGTRNILKTNASIQSTTSSSFPEALIDDLLVSPDLTTWVATNCTVTLISGQKYSILTTGGAATLTKALPAGSYSGLRMALSMKNVNASGQISISLASAATNAGCGDYPTNAERRLVLGTFDYVTPTVYVNPTVTITMYGTGAGGLGYIWNLRMSQNGRVPN